MQWLVFNGCNDSFVDILHKLFVAKRIAKTCLQPNVNKTYADENKLKKHTSNQQHASTGIIESANCEHTHTHTYLYVSNFNSWHTLILFDTKHRGKIKKTHVS